MTALKFLNQTVVISLSLVCFTVGCEYLDRKADEIDAAEVAGQEVTVMPDFNKPSTDANGIIPDDVQVKPEATPVPDPSATPTPQAKASQTSVGSLGGAGYTNTATTVYGGTAAQRARLLKIAKNVETVINSEAFKKRLLGNTYKGKLGFYGTTAKPDYVLKEMREADEFNRGKTDKIWQYELYIQKLPAGILGRMYWPKDPIYFNSLHLDTRTDSGLAGTYVHEKSHQLGFTHSQLKTPERQYSVPYTVGTICAEIYKGMKL